MITSFYWAFSMHKALCHMQLPTSFSEQLDEVHPLIPNCRWQNWGWGIYSAHSAVELVDSFPLTVTICNTTRPSGAYNLAVQKISVFLKIMIDTRQKIVTVVGSLYKVYRPHVLWYSQRRKVPLLWWWPKCFTENVWFGFALKKKNRTWGGRDEVGRK